MKNIEKVFDVQEVKEILESIVYEFPTINTKTNKAFTVMDENSNFVIALMLLYNDNGEGMPGNYSLSMTFDKEDLCNIEDVDEILDVRREKGKELGKIFSSILEELKSMPLEEEISFELDGYFTITRGRGEEQGDDDIFSIVPGSVLKRLVKNDELLEETIEE